MFRACCRPSSRALLAGRRVPHLRLAVLQPFTAVPHNTCSFHNSRVSRLPAGQTFHDNALNEEDERPSRQSRKTNPYLPFQASSFVDAFITTIVGVGIIFTAGAGYLWWYKRNVLVKMEGAFSAGTDPALELARHSKKSVITHAAEGSSSNHDEAEQVTRHLRRNEQDIIDRIIQGVETGHYYVLLGAKGAGKTTMVFDAMTAIQAEGVAMCDAHPDLEVFRLRLGKALNYEFNEDSQASLFQRRDPREAGPALDIERALNKLEKVALRYTQKKGRSPVLVVNNIHHFHNDEDGRNVLLQLQQRAEAWAAAGILTMVFSSDDFWPLFVMRQSASRMQVISIRDLSAREALQASLQIRLNTKNSSESTETIKKAVAVVGGRLSYLNRVSKARDMTEMADHMQIVEKGWLLSRIGLISDCDDDVMDEQKWCSCSWLLLKEFVKMWREHKEEVAEKISNGELDPAAAEDLTLPSISYYMCRQIMTRADYLEELDRLNIVNIDVNHEVRPDSMLILHAARDVVEEEGFEELLNSVRDRIDEIESLHRTRELTFKDIEKGDKIKLSVDKREKRTVDWED